jgi:hypothetical protein
MRQIARRGRDLPLPWSELRVPITTEEQRRGRQSLLQRLIGLEKNETLPWMVVIVITVDISSGSVYSGNSCMGT